MGVERLKIQLTLRSENEEESKIIDYLNKTGKRSGMPKAFMIAGYKAMQELENAPQIAGKVEKQKAATKTKPDILNMSAGG